MSSRRRGLRHGRSPLVLGVAGALALAALIGPPAAESAASLQTKTFSAPGVFEFTVPGDVTSITVTATGAAGGSCNPTTTDTAPGTGGQGATTKGTFDVTPGAQLIVGVGGKGGDCAGGFLPVVAVRPSAFTTGLRPFTVTTSIAGGAGGVNGGAAGGTGDPGGVSGAGGGGASAVLTSPTSPLIVAGGGGGASYCTGNGGNADAAGVSGTGCSDVPGFGGGAGTVATGGAGGAAATGDTLATAGATGTTENGGVGGHGDTDAPSASGGGGGGGVNGGGGGGGGGPGSGGGGGGGGASFVLPGASGVTAPAPTSAAAGVTITYMGVPGPTAVTHQATGVKKTSCTLHGAVDGQGLATTAWFDWGKSKSYGHTTSKHSNSGASTSVSAVIKGLTPGKTYHFRVVAKTASGTAVGKDMKCTTPKPKPKRKVKPVFTG